MPYFSLSFSWSFPETYNVTLVVVTQKSAFMGSCTTLAEDMKLSNI